VVRGDIVLKGSFLQIESYRKGAVFSSLFNVVAKGLNFFSAVVIAYFFGTNEATDVYFSCYVGIALLAGFVTNFDSTVLIPEFMRMTYAEDIERSHGFINFFWLLYVCVGVVVGGIMLLDPVRYFSFLSQFHTEVLRRQESMLLATIPLLVMIVINTFLIDVLASKKFFTLPAIVVVINNVCAIGFIFIFHKTLNVSSAIYGLLLSFTIQFAFLIYIMKHLLHWKFHFKKPSFSPPFLKNVIFALCGNFTSVLAGYAPVYLLSGFSSGIITMLNYGQRTGDIPTQLVTSQVSSVAAIKFNELYAKKEFQLLNNSFLIVTKTLIFLVLPLSGIMILYAQEIVTMLYQRGAFDIKSTILTAELLKYFACLIPMYVFNTMVSRLFMAGQKIRESFWYQIVFNVILISLVWCFTRSIGYIGVPVALLTVYTANIIVCALLVKKFFPFIQYMDAVLFFIGVLSLNLFSLGTALLMKTVLKEIPPLLNLGMGALVYFAIVLLVNAKLGLVQYINEVLFRKNVSRTIM
jgi:putative peptidoglycan lipid II flippase